MGNSSGYDSLYIYIERMRDMYLYVIESSYNENLKTWTMQYDVL